VVEAPQPIFIVIGNEQGSLQGDHFCRCAKEVMQDDAQGQEQDPKETLKAQEKRVRSAVPPQPEARAL
jgi:hypothetical protein